MLSESILRYLICLLRPQIIHPFDYLRKLIVTFLCVGCSELYWLSNMLIPDSLHYYICHNNKHIILCLSSLTDFKPSLSDSLLYSQNVT